MSKWPDTIISEGGIEPRNIANEFPHYYKDVRHLDFIDIYRVLELWDVKDPAIQHAIKKLMVAGRRGVKDLLKDYKEAKVSIERAEAMKEEDARAKRERGGSSNPPMPPPPPPKRLLREGKPSD